jgi:hypothetical protein
MTWDKSFGKLSSWWQKTAKHCNNVDRSQNSALCPLNSELKASSLVEVLVSLSLVSIVFVIAAMIWLQISGLQSPYHQTDQRMAARKLIDQAIATHALHDQTFTIQGIQYFRAIHPLHPENRLYEITVTAYQQDQAPFFKRSKIVRYDAD